MAKTSSKTQPRGDEDSLEISMDHYRGGFNLVIWVWIFVVMAYVFIFQYGSITPGNDISGNSFLETIGDELFLLIGFKVITPNRG